MHLLKNKPFIQIGANIGNDYFTQLCEKYSPCEIILIEPFEECQKKLKVVYNNFKCKISYEQLAVVDNDTITEVKLFTPTGETAHASVNPMKNWGKQEDRIVPATTITNIFKKYNLKDIGLLFIDTEGNDARIINSIDLNEYNIDVIHYEFWGFNDDDFDDKNILNGKSGMEFIKNKLEKAGYNVKLNDKDYIASKIG